MSVVDISSIDEMRFQSKESGEFRTEAAAFIPFSSGPANCAGKNLALLEMRLLIALLLHRFDMQFDPTYDSALWEKDLEDWFIMKAGPLPVMLTSRY